MSTAPNLPAYIVNINTFPAPGKGFYPEIDLVSEVAPADDFTFYADDRFRDLYLPTG